MYRDYVAYFDGYPFSHGATAVAHVPHLVRYYDDNNWIGMNFIKAYQQSGLTRLLRGAEGIMRFIYTGEWRPRDPPTQQFHPGGIYWNTRRRKRGIDANGGAIEMALQLYLLTRHGNAARREERTRLREE